MAGEEVGRARSVDGAAPQPRFILNVTQITIAAAAAVALLHCSRGGHAQTRLPIVATTTDLKSLAEAVGGERVEVIALVPPNVDAEEYQPRPHDLNRLKDARLVLRVGVDYDLWLDRLATATTGNRAIARGGPAHVDCSFGIALLDVRGAQVGPGGGHAHGSGNPHYWLDPANAEMITGVILETLARIDPPTRNITKRSGCDSSSASTRSLRRGRKRSAPCSRARR